MADIVLIGIVVLAFFAVGFAVGVLIVGVIGRWRNGRQRRDADRKSGADVINSGASGVSDDQDPGIL